MNSLRVLEPDQLGWDLAGPCNDCPFRRNAPDHEGIVANLPEYMNSIDEQRFCHTCHKTDNQADGPKNHKGKIQHCAGALHFMVRAKCDLQLPLIRAADRGQIDLKALTKRARNDKRVFASVKELLEYYVRMGERILAQKQSDPEVVVISNKSPRAEPEMMRLSEAKAKGVEIMPCAECGSPAVKADSLWPYHQDRNYCAEHEGQSLNDSIVEIFTILNEPKLEAVL